MLLLERYEVTGRLGKDGTLGKSWITKRNNIPYAVKQIETYETELETLTLRGKSYLRHLNSMKNSKGDHLVNLIE